MHRSLTAGPGTLLAGLVPGATQAPSGDVLALVAVVLVGGGAVLLWRRHSGLFAVLSTAPAPDAGVAASDVEPAAATDTTTDEDRIVALLRDNDGRMRQSAIVERTGWSKSKVSVLLSEMDDGGEINKLRLGRENIISLPGHEPDATRSPHDE